MKRSISAFALVLALVVSAPAQPVLPTSTPPQVVPIANPYSASWTFYATDSITGLGFLGGAPSNYVQQVTNSLNMLGFVTRLNGTTTNLSETTNFSFWGNNAFTIPTTIILPDAVSAIGFGDINVNGEYQKTINNGVWTNFGSTFSIIMIPANTFNIESNDGTILFSKSGGAVSPLSASWTSVSGATPGTTLLGVQNMENYQTHLGYFTSTNLNARIENARTNGFATNLVGLALNQVTNIASTVGGFATLTNIVSSVTGGMGIQNPYYVTSIGTNVQAYNSSNITVLAPLHPSASGTYVNITPIGSSTGFIAWRQLGGTNFITQNNKQATLAWSTPVYILGGLTNDDGSSSYAILTESDASTLPTVGMLSFTTWGDQTDELLVPILTTYSRTPFSVVTNAAPLINVSLTNNHVFYVGNYGNDFSDGHNKDFPMQHLTWVVNFATNLGDVIYVLPGQYIENANLASGTSLIGSGNSSNTCYISGVQLSGFGTTGGYAGHFYTGALSCGSPTNSEVFTFEDITVRGSEPFFTGGGAPSGDGSGEILFKGVDFSGQVTTSDDSYLAYFKNCTFRGGNVTMGLYTFSSELLVTNVFDGCTFLIPPIFPNAQAAVIGYFGGGSGSSADVTIMPNCVFDKTLNPTAAITTNCTVHVPPYIGNGYGLTNVTPIAPTIIKTNLSLATVGVNNWGRPIQICSFSVNLSEAGVVGVSGIQIEVPGQITNRVSSITSIAGTIVGSDTNALPGAFVPVGGTWNIRDISQGAGNSSSIGNGGQQIIVY